ncbi:MAG: choice-of-anchor D domain-containing protein [Bacteroidales bacterium]
MEEIMNITNYFRSFRSLYRVCFVIFLLFLLLSSTTNAQASDVYQTSTGNLSITIYNVDGTKQSGTKVFLFDSTGTQQVPGSPKITDSNGIAGYSNLTPDSYVIQVEYQPTGVTPSVNELWGSKSVTVIANQTSSVRFDRAMPTIDIRQSPAIIIPPNVIVGTSSTIQVKVFSPQGATYSTRVKLILDRSKSSPYDVAEFACTPNPTNVGSSSTTFSCPFTVSSEGTYYIYYKIESLSNTWWATDQGHWSSSFTATESKILSLSAAPTSPGAGIVGQVFNLTANVGVQTAQNSALNVTLYRGSTNVSNHCQNVSANQSAVKTAPLSVNETTDGAKSYTIEAHLKPNSSCPISQSGIYDRISTISYQINWSLPFSVTGASARINGSSGPINIGNTDSINRSGTISGTGNGTVTYRWEYKSTSSSTWIQSSNYTTTMTDGSATVSSTSVSNPGVGNWDYRIVVSNPSSVNSNNVRVNVTAPPAIDSLSPTSGPRNIRVEINGSNFGDSRGTNGRVDFGGVYISSDVISWTNTKIMIAVPSTLSTGSKTITVRNDSNQISGSKTFTVNDDPNVIITNSPALVCPSSVTPGQSFDVTATLRNGASGTAQNGGISFSFPSFTLQHAGMTGTGPYETTQGRVQTLSSDGMTVSYFDQGDLIDKDGSQGSADHLLIESNAANWVFGSQKTLTLRVTPNASMSGQTLRIRMRGTLAWGGESEWMLTSRDPRTDGAGIENDQQYHRSYYCDVNVIGTYNLTGTVKSRQWPYPVVSGVTVTTDNDFNAVTNSQGKYTIPNIPGGSRTVIASRSGWWATGTNVTASKNINLTGNETVNFTEFTTQMSPEVSISVDKSSVMPGETFNVTVSLKNMNTALAGKAFLDLSFNGEKVNIGSISNNGYWTGGSGVTTFSPGATGVWGVTSAGVEYNLPSTDVVDYLISAERVGTIHFNNAYTFTVPLTVKPDATSGVITLKYRGTIEDKHAPVSSGSGTRDQQGWNIYTKSIAVSPNFPIPSLTIQTMNSPYEESPWVSLGSSSGIYTVFLAYEPGKSSWFANGRPLFQTLVDHYLKAIWAENSSGTWVNNISLERELAINAQNKAEWNYMNISDFEYAGFKPNEKGCINRIGDDNKSYYICTPDYLTQSAKNTKVYDSWFLWDLTTNGTDDPAVRREIYKKVLLQLVMQEMNEEYKAKLNANLDSMIETTLKQIEPGSNIADFGWQILTLENPAYQVKASNLAVWYTQMGAANHQLAILDNTATVIKAQRGIEMVDYFQGFGSAILGGVSLSYDYKAEIVRATMLNQLANLESLQRIAILDEFISQSNDSELKLAWEDAKWDYKIYSNSMWDGFIYNMGQSSLIGDTVAYLADVTGFIAHVCGNAGLSRAMSWALPIHMAWSGWNAINDAQDKMRAAALAMTLEEFIREHLNWQQISFYGGTTEIDRIEYTLQLHAMRVYLAAISFDQMYHAMNDSFLLNISDWILGTLGVEDNDEMYAMLLRRRTENLAKYNAFGAPNFLASDDIEYLNRNIRAPYGARASMSSLELRLGTQKQLNLTATNSGGAANPFYIDTSVSSQLELAPSLEWERHEIGTQLWQNGDTNQPTLISQYLHYGIDDVLGGESSIHRTLTIIGENPGTGFLSYRTAMVPDGFMSVPETTQRFPLSGQSDQQGWPAIFLPVTVLEDPIPAISSNVSSINLYAGEKYTIVFTLANTGGKADATYVDVSVPQGLDVFSTSPSQWDRYDVGTDIKHADGSISPATELLYSLPLASHDGYKSNIYEITIVANQAGNYNIKYRASLNPKGITNENSTGDTFIRTPTSSNPGAIVDQQGWYAWKVPVTVGTNNPPIISSVQPTNSPDNLHLGACRIYSVQASDPNGRQLSYFWYLDNKIVSQTSSFEYCPQNGEESQHQLGVRVSDGVLTTDHTWIIVVQTIPQSPTLSWTGETNYTSDGLHPESGDTSTSYGYRVKYTDPDGHAPNYVRVHIKQGGVEIADSPFAMTCSGTTYTTGVICSYTKSGLAAGTDYTYYFTAQNSQGANAESSIEKDTPDVNDINPLPTLSILNPPSATAGGSAFTLTVNGTNFVNGSKVRWNGADRTTTYVSSTQLTASIPASDIASAGTATVTVFNPAPGGGTSGGLPFSVDNVAPTTLFFADKSWIVRSATGGPGGAGRLWSDSPLSVNTDSNGLHLRIRQQDSNWYSAQVHSELPVSYGLHCFKVDGRVDLLDKNVVLGLFLYKDDQHEIDIEFAKWGSEFAKNTQYVIQPSTPGGANKYLYDFNITLNGDYSTHCINWQPEYVEYTSYHGHGAYPPSADNLIEYKKTPNTQYIPQSDDSYKIIMNLWLIESANLPSNGQPVEITIKDFSTTSENPVPTLSNLNPSYATAGSSAFNLTVNGTNFANGSKVRWNGTDRTTMYVNSTQLTASIPASDTASAGTATVTVFNPAPGGGTSGGLTFTIDAVNPVPTLSNLNPSSATAGGSAFTLTVNGTNFVNGSKIRWNGADYTTTYVSGTQLTASIFATDIASAGTASVTVFNSAPGGGTSSSAAFSINNPSPTISNISPASTTPGGSAFTLMVNGSNFINGSKIRWNGTDRPTTYVSGTQLTASIPAADIVAAGTAAVTVFNPAPGGGTSNQITFTIPSSTCGTEIFSDDFSTAKAWIDQSNGYVVHDMTNQWLNWNAVRSHPMRYYYPISASSDCIQLKFRFRVNSASGNGMMFIGLVENLDAPIANWSIDATGVFVGPSRDTAFGHKVMFGSSYSDGNFEGKDTHSSTIDYGGFNVWRKAILRVNQGNWDLIITDDNDTKIGQMSGTQSQIHTAYNYVALIFDSLGGWESEAGYLDDIAVQGTPKPMSEIDVKGSGNSILSGDNTPSINDHTDFGNVLITNGVISRTFTILNTGQTNLNLTGTPTITLSGANAGDFTITTQPINPISPNGETSFTVTFDPSAEGTRSAVINIANSDSDENPYTFAIQGTGITVSPTGWQYTSNLVTPRYMHGVARWGNNLYVLGGEGSGAAILSSIERTTINPDGSLSAWQIIGQLSSARRYLKAIAVDGLLYVVGGDTSTGRVNTVEYAVINPDGTLGDWQSTSSMLTARTNFGLTAANDVLYAIGGQGSTSLSSVEYAPILPDGSLGVWQPTTGLNIARQGTDAIAVNGYLYIPSGNNTGGKLANMEYAAIQADGSLSAWTSAGGITTARVYHAVATDGISVYLIGGSAYAGNNSISLVERSAIAANHTPGTWQSFHNLKRDKFGLAAVYANGFIYATGGHRLGDYVSDVEYIQANSEDAVPEMDVRNNSTSIGSGSTLPSLDNGTNFGSVNLGSESAASTFTIHNFGSADLLLLGSPKIQVSGTHAADFVVLTQPSRHVLPGDSTVFRVNFVPKGAGIRTAIISIINSDSDENPYTFTIQGTGVFSSGDFGVNNLVRIMSQVNETAADFEKQADGKIVIGGYSGNGSNDNFLLIRLNPDGSFDNNFGNNGRVTTDLGGKDQIWDIGIQTDGKIVAVGNSLANRQVAIVRYNTNGSLDISFNGTGIVTFEFDVSASNDTARHVAFQNDGKIIVSGVEDDKKATNFVLARLTSDGKLDPSFSGDGKVTLDIGGQYVYDSPEAGVLIQPDGKIIQGGFQGSRKNFILVRWNSDGTLDTSFGPSKNGVVITGFEVEASVVVPYSSLLLNDGKILLAGTCQTDNTSKICAARYLPNGMLDTSFGNGGKIIIGKSPVITANTMALQVDGKYLFAGLSHDSWTSPYEISLNRFNPDGSMDTEFNNRPPFLVNGVGIEGLAEILLRSDDKLLILGTYKPDGVKNIFVLQKMLTTVPTNPVANNDQYIASVNKSLVVPVESGVLQNDSDSGGLRLTATLSSPPSHGTMTLNSDGSFTYIPDKNFVGEDSFTYIAQNGFLSSNIATIKIVVIGVPVTDQWRIFIPMIAH